MGGGFRVKREVEMVEVITSFWAAVVGVWRRVRDGVWR